MKLNLFTAWLTAALHFNPAVAFAYVETRLTLRRRSIDHSAVFEGKLRAVPRADDGSVLERAFRQRSTQVRA